MNECRVPVLPSLCLLEDLLASTATLFKDIIVGRFVSLIEYVSCESSANVKTRLSTDNQHPIIWKCMNPLKH